MSDVFNEAWDAYCKAPTKRDMGRSKVDAAVRSVLKRVPEPSHYAVVDEYGDILFSSRIVVILDAERKCQDYIRQCRKDPVTRNEALNWTIKGVTVNED